MNVNLTPNDLIAFEDDIIKAFENKKIRAPIHLDSNNEDQLIEIFKNYVNEEDWVCGTWRMHYRCLLKGVNPGKLRAAILNGRSISLFFKEEKIIASAIVGGIIPIALGLALAIKRKGDTNKVVCFMGDMSAETGMAHECIKYATNFGLPILFVVENNFVSVCTDTKQSWGMSKLTYEPDNYSGGVVKVRDNVLYYEYKSKFPHAGGLSRVNF